MLSDPSLALAQRLADQYPRRSLLDLFRFFAIRRRFRDLARIAAPYRLASINARNYASARMRWSRQTPAQVRYVPKHGLEACQLMPAEIMPLVIPRQELEDRVLAGVGDVYTTYATEGGMERFYVDIFDGRTWNRMLPDEWSRTWADWPLIDKVKAAAQ